MTLEFANTYAAQPAAPSRARSWSQQRLRDVLADHPGAAEIMDEAAIVVSELVTNAIQAGTHVATLTLSVGDDTVRIGVTDDADGNPRVTTTGAEDEHGRGLQIVDALCQSWGVERTGTGKRVWAELAF
jgi:anti-sigma regulatory factor (Ser/Thr protein kinase)